MLSRSGLVKLFFREGDCESHTRQVFGFLGYVSSETLRLIESVEYKDDEYRILFSVCPTELHRREIMAIACKTCVPFVYFKFPGGTQDMSVAESLLSER